jgi:hypothetical protein
MSTTSRYLILAIVWVLAVGAPSIADAQVQSNNFLNTIIGIFHVSGKVVNSLSGMARGRRSSAVGP